MLAHSLLAKTSMARHDGAAMSATTPSTPEIPEQTILAIDIGGSHIKIRTNRENEEQMIESGPGMTADKMLQAVKSLAADWHYDVVAIGYPATVRHHQPTAEPANLGPGWVSCDFSAAFGCPVRMVNDALLQAIGSYDGGRMLFLGLGTGLGSAMIIENVAQPMELAHLPYRDGMTFEDFVGIRGLERLGEAEWHETVIDVITRLRHALQPEYLIIGGGNVRRLPKLPTGCRRGDNSLALKGGFRLWQDSALII